MQTRKVNTYGRRSIAIVSAPAGFGRPLPTPQRAGRQTSPSPDSPLSEISAGIIVVSPSHPRSSLSPVTRKRSKMISTSNNLPKKENLLADMSALSISSPPITRPRKRKPLIISSPKVRGSPKQSRRGKNLPTLMKASPRRTRAPLHDTNTADSKPPKKSTHASIIQISDDGSFAAPKKPKPPSTPSAEPVANPKAWVGAPSESVIVISDDSADLDTSLARLIPPSLYPRTSFHPLARQDAIIGTPPLPQRLSTGTRLSAGSLARLSFGPLVNVSSPHPPTPPIALDDNLPSPVDSEDEVAFLDAVAELESRPISPPPPVVRTRSELRTISRSQPLAPGPYAPASKMFGASSSLTNVEPKATKPIPATVGLKSLSAPTKSLPLAPRKSRPSIVYVDVPPPKKYAQPKPWPDSTEQPLTVQPTSSHPAQPSKPPKPAKSLESRVKVKTPKESAAKTLSPRPGPSKSQSAKRPAKLQPPPAPTPPSHTHQLKSLLDACSQPEPIDLDAFVATFSTDDIHTTYPAPPSASVLRRRWRKIGEASYSEVFGLGGVVVKIVPLKMEDGWKDGGEEGPCVSEMVDVEKEIAVTRAMGEIQEGFIKLVRAHVARGRYPQELLELWDAWDREFGSESIRPDSFLPSQLYVLLILPDGGPDLEHYNFAPRTSWRAAAGIFWQVARTLARAESLVRFEHRDLHWGQILVQNIQLEKDKKSKSKSKSKAKAHSGAMDSPEQSGIRVTLIDLGLSRMDTHTRKAWFTEPEPEIFEGEGDFQFDLYRMMKAHFSSDEMWESYKPLTNVMWLHYLARQLLTAKGLRKPDTITSRYHTADDVQAEIQAFSCLVETEKVLAAAISKAGGTAITKAGGAILKKAAKGVSGSGVQKLTDAQSVVRWGAERRWVNAACGSVDERRGAL